MKKWLSYIVVLMSLLFMGYPTNGCAEESSISASNDYTSQNQLVDDKAEGKRDFQAAVAAFRQTPAPQPEVSPWPMVKGLALCLAVFCGIVFVLKKLNPNHTIPGKTRRMRVVEKLPIAQKSALLLVEIDGRTKLIGVGPDNITDIEYRERPRAITRTPSFEKILSDASSAEGVA